MLTQWGTHRHTYTKAAPGYQFLWPGVVAALIPPIFGSAVFLAQEFPRQRLNGFVHTQNGIQGPNVAPPGIIGSVFVRQEQPSHPLPFTKISPISSTTPQLLGDEIFVEQAQPWHPKPFVRSSDIFDPNINIGPENRWIFIRQEQPRHPLPFTLSGVQGPNVAAVGFIRGYFVRQEYPWHPKPYVYNQKFNDPITPGLTRTVFVRQEYPRFHPRPFISNIYAFIPTPPPFTIGQRVILVKQEYPQFHPKPFTFDIKFYLNRPQPTEGGTPPLLENLTLNMLTGAENKGFFYTDSGKVLTQINDPHLELQVVGWMPVGGTTAPLSNMYERDVKYTPPVGPVPWDYKIAGWFTPQENLVENKISLLNQTSFFENPTEYQINDTLQQLYGVGFMPVASDISPRSIIGRKPYG